MTPHKLASLLPELSVRTGLSPELLSQLARAYYQLLQRELSSLRYLNVDVPALGVFTLKPHALRRKLLTTRQMLGKLEKRKGAQAQAIRHDLTTTLQELELLLALYDAEQQRRSEIQAGRQESNLNLNQSVTTTTHEPVASFSEPESDPGGDQEQSFPTASD